ncbi:MAG TPA: glycogen/starch/alpha-glucan phosphorylase, partial [Candidatus Avoscillospira stercoripullorum]|nr:glycogen/starch/alpha-glucan phosphorylase [Candidatus Avoscillospira stercoripullorum]
PVSLVRLYRDVRFKDWFMALLDLKDYIAVKERALSDFEDCAAWTKKSLVNIANAGYFSSDRTIEQYNHDIWKL